MAYTTIDDPTAYFQCTLYAGNNGTQTITHTGHSDLQADMIWGKARNDSAAHFRIDSVRGVSKRFKQNADAESTVSTGITAIGSDSFALGNDGDFNDNSINYATWNWKAGTSFTNDASGTGIGSLDSSGSVSTTAGFSIISWTNAGSGVATVAHGLGVTPKMIIIKSRNEAAGWLTYHEAIGNTKALFLNTTGAEDDNAELFNDTSPTSTVFTTGITGLLTGGSNLIAYCFAEKQGYSKFGSYVGNGNANGTFIYTGFKPAFVMTKPSSKTGEWFMIDNKRDPSNYVRRRLKANSNAAENTDDNQDFDILSNGFKPRRSAGDWNSSGDTFIYMAFAEQPFVSSSVVPATAR